MSKSKLADTLIGADKGKGRRAEGMTSVFVPLDWNGKERRRRSKNLLVFVATTDRVVQIK